MADQNFACCGPQKTLYLLDAHDRLLAIRTDEITHSFHLLRAGFTVSQNSLWMRWPGTLKIFVQFGIRIEKKGCFPSQKRLIRPEPSQRKSSSFQAIPLFFNSKVELNLISMDTFIN
jgi:hypothetical protein